MSVVLLDADGMRRTLARMGHEILEANQGADDLVVVGVLRRGWPLAKRLAFSITNIEGVTIPCGKLDISASRDDDREDSSENGSEIPFEINGKHVILVDEVIFTGRTTRAALEELLRFGRPKSVQLAVLVDRGHRELPIQPNYAGKTIETDREDYILVKFNEIDGEDIVELQPKSSRMVPA